MPDAARPLLRPGYRSRKSSTPHYQTFPTPPPKGRGKPPASGETQTLSAAHSQNGSRTSSFRESPLPKGQLAVLAVIALAEQTALNSISPYLPEMASTFPEVKDGQIGLYVGLIASSYAMAQFATNYFWGWASDRIGRKPVVIFGTVVTAACLLAFGFCRTLWQAILVQVMMGLCNGNQGVISTCLGEITDRTNQSRAFTYLPVVYGLGGITGPLLGGLLTFQKLPWNGQPNPYPYLGPNLLSAAILVVDAIVIIIWLEESLEQAPDLPPLGEKFGNLFTWIWQFTSHSTRPTYVQRAKKSFEARQYDALRRNGSASSARNRTAEDLPEEDSEADDDDLDDEQESTVDEQPVNTLDAKTILNRDTILLLTTYLIFQLGNISFNSLYPIFGQAKPPIGRNLGPEEIGLSLGFAGVVTIIFQIGLFGKLRDRVGNKISYRGGLLAFAVACLLMPFVGYKDGRDGLGNNKNDHGKVLLYSELGGVLIIKTVAAVGCLTASLLMITNSAPNHQVLGALNGLAQTLSAFGRAVGPFISGALFSASTHVKPKGEAVAFGVFGGLSFVAFLLSLGIRGVNLEGADHNHHHHHEDEEAGHSTDEDDEDEGDAEEEEEEEEEEEVSSPSRAEGSQSVSRRSR